MMILIPAIFAGCGSSDGNDQISADEAYEPYAREPIQILKPDGVFTIEDVFAAGWKKSKELSPETLPGATGVWYGFYQQRDVEVRVYESQASAISDGQDIADETTGRSKPNPYASTGLTRSSYLAYGIVGNLILLCEIKIEDCQGLLESIE
jgi:hypothetical protein